MVFGSDDVRFMRRALALAERGRGTTRPNPIVGALVVRGGRVLASGFHRRAGEPHAEIEALVRLGRRAAGATLYVTLEPCCHVGRTGPCTEVIVSAGVRRVVIGCRDRNPLVDGRGIAHLRRAGIRVDVGCLEEECRRQNRAFFCWIRQGRPLVTLKVASTLDGYIAPPRGARGSGPGTGAPGGRINWVTGVAARREAHRLRAAHDAVLVGAGTVAADDPRLTVRLPRPGGRHAQPLRVVLDGGLRISPRARVLRGPGAPTAVIVAARPRRSVAAATSRRVRALERAGAEVLLLPAGAGGRLRVGAVLAALARRGVQSILVEGGGRVLGAFVAAGLVDRVAWFVAPRLAGGGVPAVSPAAGTGARWARLVRLGPVAVRTLGDDILLDADAAADRRSVLPARRKPG